MIRSPIEELSMADLVKLFERQVQIHGLARFLPLLEDPSPGVVENLAQEESDHSPSENGSEDVLTNSDFGIDGNEDEEFRDNASDEDDYISDDGDDNQSVVDEVLDNIRAGNMIHIHESINFDSLHCPPLGSILISMFGACDCSDFGMVCCGQIDDFQFFASMNLMEELDDASKTINSPLRIASNLLRKRLYKLLYHAIDFGILEKNERRKLPNCVVAKIRQIYPSSSGDYMGFKEN